MPLLTSDLDNAYKLSLAVVGENRGYSESYLMASETKSTALLAAKHLAYWRAAILGIDMSLAYAVVSKLGPDKNSWVVINAPIRGGVGVKFPSVDDEWTEQDAKVNSPGVGPRFRLETDEGLHSIRLIRGVPDYMVEEFKLQGSILDLPEAVATDTTYVLSDANLPISFYWPFPDTTPPENAADFVNWREALRLFLRVTFAYTKWGKIIAGTEGENGTLQSHPWAKVIYRKISERSAGVPSLR